LNNAALGTTGWATTRISRTKAKTDWFPALDEGYIPISLSVCHETSSVTFGRRDLTSLADTDKVKGKYLSAFRIA
jgi:hypothetical protein